MSQNKLFRYGAILFIGIAFQQLISFLISIYAGSIFNINQFGTLQILRTFLGYSSLYALGIPIAFMYDLPKQLALKKNENITKIETNLFSISTLSLIFLPISFLFYFFNFKLNGESIEHNWIIVSLIIIAETMRARSTLLLRSYQSYKLLSYTILIHPLIYGSLGYFLIKQYMLEGFLWATFISSFLVYLISLRYINRINHISFDLRYLISKAKVGLPIKLGSLIWTFSVAGGLYIISDSIGPFETGIYGFSMLCGTALMVLPNVIKELFTPKIIASFTLNEKNRVNNDEILYQGIILFISIGFLSSILALVFFDFLIILFLSKYIPAISLIVILIVGYFSNLTKGFSRDYLILKKEQNILFAFDLFILALVFTAQCIGGYVFKNVYVVVFSTTAGLFMISFIPLLYYLKKYSFNKRIKLINTVISSSIIVIPLVYSLNYFIEKNQEQLLVTIIPILSIIIVCLLFVKYAFEKFNFSISHIKNIN